MKDKNEIQQEIINTIVDNNCRGIVLSSVRSGKTRILINSINKHSLEDTPSILILYPNIDIKVSWEVEFELIKHELSITPEITYSTFASIEKVKNNKYSYVLIDEAHLLGEENQLPIAGEIAKNNEHVLFASGTYNEDTLADIKIHSQMDLIVNYSTEQAIKDGIVNDFNIYIHTYNLDFLTIREFGKTKKWKSTEKKECNRLGNRIIRSEGQSKMFASLERMRFINQSNSLINCVKQWLADNLDKRFILFASDEKTGTKYSLPMFNSKSKDDLILKEFQNEKINKLCLIKKGGVGISYPNLDCILITAINSNGEALEQQIGRALLTDTDMSNIHIFVSSEAFQQNWLKKALTLINKNKIHYI